MELGIELELDNRQFSLLRAEARSGSGLRRVGSCLTKFLNKRKAKLHFFQMASANFVDLSTVLKTFCGKPQYIAQEVMHGQWASLLCRFKPYSLKGTAGATVLSSTGCPKKNAR